MNPGLNLALPPASVDYRHTQLGSVVTKYGETRGFEVRRSQDGWYVELTSSGEVVSRICGFRFDLNSSASAALAKSKTGASEALAWHEVPCIRHSREVPTVQGRWVTKPDSGTGGRDIGFHVDTHSALARFEQLQGKLDLVFSPWEDLVNEYRVVVLDGEVLLIYRKSGVLWGESGGRLHNLGLGAVPTELAGGDDDAIRLSALARQAAHALGLRVVCVDIVQPESGPIKVLEVNDGIMLEHFAAYSSEYRARAVGCYTQILNRAVSEQDQGRELHRG